MVCRSAPWGFVARHIVVPWALQGAELSGDALEVGCGSGAMAAEVLRRFPDVRLTAIDVDESMVAAARRRLGPFGDRARVRRADATALPFDDGSFDATLSFTMLHHVVDWELAVGELVRVLRPGGRLLGFDLLADRVGRVERGHHHGIRRMHHAELEQALRGLPVEQTSIRPAFARLVTRFTTTRSTPDA